MKEVIVTGKIEEQDLIRATLNNFWGKWYSKLLLVFGLFMLLPVGWLITAIGMQNLTVNHIYLLTPIALPFIFPVSLWWQAKRAYANLQEFQRNYQYTFTDNGYQIKDEKSFSQVSWESLLKIQETKDDFHLFIRKNYFSIVPKRHIKDEQDLLLLRSIFKNNVGTKVSLQN